MSFFIGKNADDRLIDTLTDAESLSRHAPDYYGPRLDAIKEMRDHSDGWDSQEPFRHIASFVNVPLFNAIGTVLNPDFMRNKNNFYAWLDRNPEYCVYDRRSHSPGRAAKGIIHPGGLWKEKDDDGSDEGWNDGKPGELSPSPDSTI
ncbi:MAG TPA: hypothetical protein VJM10_02325 [Candidatus Methylomirabilis sp.]|nr:hypothetical protein [Candidatus Methylomirabilis sp.]